MTFLTPPIGWGRRTLWDFTVCRRHSWETVQAAFWPSENVSHRTCSDANKLLRFSIAWTLQKKWMLYFISKFFQMEKEKYGNWLFYSRFRNKVWCSYCQMLHNQNLQNYLQNKGICYEKHLGSQFKKTQNTSCVMIQKYTTKCAVIRTFEKFQQQI